MATSIFDSEVRTALDKGMRKHALSLLCLFASLWLLQCNVAICEEPDERYRGELEIRKQVLQGEPATSSAPYDKIRGTFVSDLIKELSLSEKPTRPQIRISGVTVEGDLYLTDLVVWSKIRIETCVFKGSVFLTNTSFRRGLSCHGSTFEKGASFADLKVEGSELEYSRTQVLEKPKEERRSSAEFRIAPFLSP